MFKKNGFSLIELVIVFAIIAALGTAMVAVLNPGALTNRGYDARRKKDIRSIKIAFEEYFNDRECYPTVAEVDALTCRQKWYSLNNFPCDPAGGMYKIQTSGGSCPRWFRVLTNLQNKQDKDIPPGWYGQSDFVRFGNPAWTKNVVNFGVSSTNINWYDEMVPSWCKTASSGDNCGWNTGPFTGCTSSSMRMYSNRSQSVFIGIECSPECQVSCCEAGAICK